MGEFSIIHWVIVAAVLLILFGPSRLPQIGSSLGESIRAFRKAFKEVEEDRTNENQVQTSLNAKKESSTLSNHSASTSQPAASSQAKA